jgi:hypothetical protein
MTHEELKAAWLDGSLVEYETSDGTVFEATVTGLMYRLNFDKTRYCEAELTPTNGANCVTMALPKRIRRIG